MAAAKTKDTYLAVRHRRIASRRGPLEALVATEHALHTATWHILTANQPYRDPGAGYLTQLRRDRAIARALHRLEVCGYDATFTARTSPGT